MTRLGIVAVALSLAGQVPSPSPADVDHYRVDMEYVLDGERVTMRRYIDGTRSRMETTIDGETFITIELGDAAGTTYVLMPEERRAMKMTRAGQNAANDAPGASPATAANVPPMELVGNETVDGKSARKYRVQTPEGEGFVWLDVDREVPLRMESAGMRIDMKNYDFSPLAPELFLVPRGYEVMDVDQMMRSASLGSMALRGAAGAAGARGGAAAGSQLGAAAGASIGGALGGPIGSMIGSFLGQQFGKKAGQKVGAAAAGAVIP